MPGPLNLSDAAARRLLGIALGATAAAIWGGNAVIARQAVASEGFVPLDIALLRSAPRAACSEAGSERIRNGVG